MFMFSTELPEDEDVKLDKQKLPIQDVLRELDAGNFNYFETLDPEMQKLFTPYTVLRWMGSLDDSVQLTFNARSLESVFGTWKTTGKAALQELVQEFGADRCTGVSKYAHTERDWRIKFSVTSVQAGNELSALIKEFVPGAKPEFISLCSTELAQDNIQMLNLLCNENFWEVNKHPHLVWKLFCLVSVVTTTEQKQRTWIPFNKNNRSSESEIYKIIKESLPPINTQFNVQEYKIILKSIDSKQFDELLKTRGFQDNERKALMKKFKTEIAKYE